MSDYFPQEIMLQILHKLPMKSLVCCTSVCKTWNSLIKNPSFISTHLTLTISSNTHLLLFCLCSRESEHYSLHFDNNNQQLYPYMVLDFPFRSFSRYFCVIGSFNGIICLVDYLLFYTDTFILWNPSIKKSLTLPKPSVTFSIHCPSEAFIGFGFDSKTNDYKILRILQFLDYKDEEEAFIEVELYSLNTNCWKIITSVAPKYEFNERDMQGFVNGVVHWVAFKRMRDGGFRNLVLGFDMGDEVFQEIKLPESLANVIPMDLSVRKYGDSSIAVIKEDWYDPLQCDIWVMKEYGVVGSWTKLLSLGEQGGGLPRVLGFRKCGEVVLQMNRGWIVSFDPQNKEVKDLGLREGAGFSFVDGYVESLVLLDNANAVSDPYAASDANAVSDANAASDVIADEGDDSVGAIDAMDEIDAIDDSNDASNDTSDDESDASNDTSDTKDDGSDASNDTSDDGSDAMDEIDAIDDSNDTSDDGSDASDDEMDAVDASDALSG